MRGRRSAVGTIFLDEKFVMGTSRDLPEGTANPDCMFVGFRHINKP